MVSRLQIYLLAIFIHVYMTTAQTNIQDVTALQSLKDVWQNEPPSWTGSEPCGDKWEGITCINSRVVSITLASTGLSGRLSGDIESLSALQILDLSYNKGLIGNLPQSIGNLKNLTNIILVGCGFGGQIPDTIGSLPLLAYLSLNSNNFIGTIPASIGLLSNLYWLDLADNKLTGSIPVSNGSTPGLDLLHNAKHFHFGNNQLSGDIPAKLFSPNMTLIHVLLEDNRLTGRIPATIGLVQTLEVVRLDNNSLSGPVPTAINSLIYVAELYLSNNGLTGSMPNLTGMDALNYLDLSNNTFDPSEVPSWITTLESLTTLKMEGTKIRGKLPVEFFSLGQQLQTVNLRNNEINGTLDIGTAYSTQLQLVDLQNNKIEAFKQKANYGVERIILAGNPICNEDGNTQYCSISQPSTPSYTTPPQNCLPSEECSPNQVSSPTCKCAYPYQGTLFFRAPSFSNLGLQSNYEALQKSMIDSFQSHKLPVDSVSLNNPSKDLDSYLLIHLQVFPSSGDHFNRTGVSEIGFLLSNQTFKPPKSFGPFFFIGDSYQYLDGAGSGSKSKSLGVIIGATVGGIVLVILLILAGLYAFRQKRRAESATLKNNPFASWDKEKHSGGVPQLTGARSYSFEEIKKYTNNFAEINVVGSGGYGKVYRGTLPDGSLIAVKRAQQGSMQGALEFKTEIELLSRVHHKNVVSLLGFCFEQGENMLVYEYIANGTLKDSLSGKSGIRLDWMRRLKIALGAAKGIQYLHDLANPPIIHRDIKSTNILLDDHLTAKVADFGLSKNVDEQDRTHVTTQVKGTMGYLDPEYYMTQQLTEKSDVYSFGVLLLELLTAKAPIEKGKYIVREVKQAMDKTKVLYNLQEIIDSNLDSSMPAKSLETFVELALRCVEEAGANRPSMEEVVKGIANVMVMAGLNPNAESASTSENYGGGNKEYPYGKDDLFAYSGAYAPPNLEPK